MGHLLWARHTILPSPWDAWNAPSLGEPEVVCKGRGTWVILGCLHYYPFDSGWGWRDYVTELRDSEAKLYFYHLSKYLWGLNDGLEVKNRLNFSFPPRRKARSLKSARLLGQILALPLTTCVILGRLYNRNLASVSSSLKWG